MRRQPETTLPVTIIGGYLGAGKTTLVNHLLRTTDGRRLAVLVNDFGTLPIDADLIEAADSNLLSLAGGCVCCSYGDDLVRALIEIAALAPPPDHVLIETSGVALPGGIAASLSLLFDYALDAVIVVADAETTLERLSDRYMGDTLARQCADADLIVVNKCDLVAEEQRNALSEHLTACFANARLIETRRGAVAFDVILGSGDPVRRFAPGRSKVVVDNHASDSLLLSGTADIGRLADELPRLALVRAKGFLRDASGQWLTVQLAGKRASIEPAPVAVSGPQRLVVIATGASLDTAALHAALQRCGLSLDDSTVN